LTVEEHNEAETLLHKYYSLVKANRYLTREIDSDGLKTCETIYMCNDKVCCTVQSAELRTVIKRTINNIIDELEKLGVKDEHIPRL
jgi:hypothetical protein